MKRPTLHTLAASLLMVLALSACNLVQETTPTLDSNLIYTQAAQTVAAALTAQVVTLQPPTVTAPVVEAGPTSDPSAPTDNPSTPADTPAPATATPAPSETPTAQPSATPTQGLSDTPVACTDQVEFVKDISIPDESVMLPGETFVKTWQLRNTGDCTWTTAYAVVFAAGDQMGGTSPQSLTSQVAPGATVDISVEMKAPGTPGEYRGDWKLRSPGGAIFGVGSKGDGAFWVKITVEEGADELNLGGPTWRDTLDSGSNWYLLNTPNTVFSIDNGRMELLAKNPDAAEEWGLSNRPSMEDYYLQATFVTGETCEGLDRYGVLVRAPDPNQGYVFGFSCDGRYRIYAWDGQTYTPIQEWKSAAAIKQGPDETNVLGIWLDGSTIRLYANSRLLAEFTNDQFDEGQFGLMVGSGDTTDFTVFVDEVAYWELGD
ncbi:MAG TPA: NBR1-Ig-like domain-containing protein [Anaerolineales bacterium]|nr:NBR1-Ig-like domain-containing protein [Anaerolineales bacterium]